MRSIKRLLDPRIVVGALGALVLAGATASCSSDRDPLVPDGDDGGDASLLPVIEAGGEGGPAPVPDAGSPDASKLPVVCNQPVCAKSLSTIFGEGFCALLGDGTVACWGDNANGQLGRGPSASSVPSAVPQRVLGLTDIVAIDHSCAIDKNGAVFCWGTGPYLRSTTQATTKETTPVVLPIPPAKAIRVTRTSANPGTACALTESSVLCWGTNVDGQVAVPVVGAPASTPYSAQEVSIPSGAPARDLILGNAAFLIREDGTTLSWGANPPLARISSLFPDPYPRPIVLADVTAIDAAGDNVCAVAGAVAYCWGAPKRDAYASPEALERATPERVVLREPAVEIATTPSRFISDNPLRGCAVGASGTVYCWGYNNTGQVGDGTYTYALTPIAVALPEPAAQVRTTSDATCALLTSGRVYCWGDDRFGQLGGGQRPLPSRVPKEVVLP